MGFFCEVDGDKNIRMDEHELSEAEWVAREDIPEYGENLSLTHEMMQVFKKHDLRKTCVKSVEKT
jgi:NAD+ diphosphatase